MMEDIIFPALVNNQNIPGWYALSGLLDFQWKLDLDEALIRVGLPSLLLVLASWQTFSLRSLETRARTRRSRWILCGKIVSPTANVNSAPSEYRNTDVSYLRIRLQSGKSYYPCIHPNHSVFGTALRL